MKPHILQTYAMPQATELALPKRFAVHKLHDAIDPDRLLDEIGPSIRGIAGIGVPARLMARLPSLEIIANFGVGYDSIDMPVAAARKIKVTNTPGVLSDAVAELAIGMMLAVARRIPRTAMCGMGAGTRAIFPSFESCVATRSASSASGASARKSRHAYRR